MAKLRRELTAMTAVRETQRSGRRNSSTPAVAIAGYTNAGKSSLLNRLTGAGVLVEDSLFATLDPTVRRVRLPSGREVTVGDTVGFVRHLPHQLVEAFRSTLEEVGEADVIVHVIDGSEATPEAQLSAVREVLTELGVTERPEVVVLNKADIADPEVVTRMRHLVPGLLIVSASTGEGFPELLAAIDAALPQPPVHIDMVVPYARGDLLARVHAEGEVTSLEHTDDGTRVVAAVSAELADRLGHASG